MKKAVRTFVFLMILLLCLAVFVVACDKEAPEEQAPDTPPADTPSNEDPSTEDSTPSAPEQPAEKPLPEVLTAPLTETFAAADDSRIREINSALDKAGIPPIHAKERFREQHAETYIGNLNGNELYLVQHEVGYWSLVRLLFNEDGLSEAFVYTVADTFEWLSLKTLRPEHFANIREDALQLMLTLAVKDSMFTPSASYIKYWKENFDQTVPLSAVHYYNIPEDAEGRQISITFFDGAIYAASFVRRLDTPTLPENFYSTPDVLYDLHIDFALALLHNNGYDISDRNATRQLLRELWADHLLQSNDDYDTYALPASSFKVARVINGTHMHIDAYTVPKKYMDVAPVTTCAPADILAHEKNLTECLLQAILLPDSVLVHRTSLIRYWSDYYIGSDDLTDYFYATVPTEAQIAANEPLDVLAVRYPKAKDNGLVFPEEAYAERHGANAAKFGKQGLDLPSFETIMALTSNSPSRYFLMLCQAHDLTSTELREELHYAWASQFLRTEETRVRDNVYNSAYPEKCLVSADIYSIRPLNGESIDELQDSDLFWIEYYEDGTVRGAGFGKYKARDKIVES